MTSSVSRTALRGAIRILSSAPRGAAIASQTAIASRSLCTSSTYQSDTLRRTEEIQLSNNDKLPNSHNPVISAPEPNESPAQIISEEAQPALSTNVSEQVDHVEKQHSDHTSPRTGAENIKSISTEKDPNSFADSLESLINNGTIRGALWQFSTAIKNSEDHLINKRSMRLMLPVLGRSGWSPTSLDTLKIAVARQCDLGTGTFNCGLHAISRSGHHQDIIEIISAMWKLPKASHPSATSYNYLIGAYVYRGLIDDAFSVLNEMKAHLVYPTFATYHALITGCLRRRDSQRAYSTLIAVEKQRFDVSAMTIAQVLVASAQNDDFEQVEHLFDKYEAAIARYSEELHRMADSRQVYRMKGPIRTTLEERSVVRGEPKLEIGAIFAVVQCALRVGRPKLALRAWYLLEKNYPSFEVPPSFWYCLIGTFAAAEDYSSAFTVLGAMVEAGLSPNLKNLEMVLIRPLSHNITKIDEQYYRLAKISEGKASYDEGGHPAKIWFEALSHDPAAKELSSPEPYVEEDPAVKELSGETQVAKEDTASEDLAAEEQIVPDRSATEESEGEALASENASDTDVNITAEGKEAEEISVEVSIDGKGKESTVMDVSRDEEIYQFVQEKFVSKGVGITELNCIIAACSAAHDLDRAFQTYDEVTNKFGLERNCDTFNGLLEGCIQTRHISGGSRVLRELESTGFPISGPTVHLAARLMIRDGRGQEVLSLIEKTLNEGNMVPPSTFQMLIRQYLRNQDVESAKQAIKLGERIGLEERTLTGRLDYAGIQILSGNTADSRAFPGYNGMRREQSRNMHGVDADSGGIEDLSGVEENLDQDIGKQ